MRLKKLMKEAEKAAFRETYITLTGRREALIERCTHVYECNEIMTRLKTPDGDVTVWGEGLVTQSFKDGLVKVVGKISSVELGEGAKNDI